MDRHRASVASLDRSDETSVGRAEASSGRSRTRQHNNRRV
jgi:hypothetical protein